MEGGLNSFERARLRRVLSYEDARRFARWTLPRGVFDYVDGGAEDELTLRRNTEALRELRLRPRVGTWAAAPRLATTVLGERISFPVLTAPCGGLKLVHPEADVGAARAAASVGTVHIASSVSGHSLEQIAAGSDGPKWFQLYKLGGRAGLEQLVERAAEAGYRAVVVTLDTQVPAKRERDWRNGFRFSMGANIETATRLAPQLVARPLWLARFIRDGLPFAVANTAAMASTPMALAQMVSGESHGPTWDDVAWVCEHFDGPVLVKGVLTAEDCLRAAELGCRGVIVSNHGGRQLDGAPAPIEVLPEVVAAVGDRLEVLLDSGVRRGSDVVKALALGARAVLVGRPYIWGLALAGQPGAEHMLELLREELTRTMQLLGCPSVEELGAGWVC
jgi:isopentenyl diphosphate isomerase/L-lactate dehydrogenase-like FMN-dependent dehydrogenase